MTTIKRRNIAMMKKAPKGDSCALPEAEFNWLFGPDVDDETLGRRIRGIFESHPDFRKKIEDDLIYLKGKFGIS